MNATGWVAVLNRLEALRTLPAGWNGDDSRPPPLACIWRAVTFLLWADDLVTLVPLVSPLEEGGVELEWGAFHRRLLSVAITRDATTVYYAHHGRTEWEGFLSDCGQLSTWLNETARV